MISSGSVATMMIKNISSRTVKDYNLDVILELGDIPQKNRKEGIFVIPVLKSSKKFYTGKPTYRKNTGIPSKYRYTVKIPVWTSTHIH